MIWSNQCDKLILIEDFVGFILVVYGNSFIVGWTRFWIFSSQWRRRLWLLMFGILVLIQRPNIIDMISDIREWWSTPFRSLLSLPVLPLILWAVFPCIPYYCRNHLDQVPVDLETLVWTHPTLHCFLVVSQELKEGEALSFRGLHFKCEPVKEVRGLATENCLPKDVQQPYYVQRTWTLYHLKD